MGERRFRAVFWRASLEKGLPLNSLSGSAGIADEVREHGLNIAELKLSKRLRLVAILPNTSGVQKMAGGYHSFEHIVFHLDPEQYVPPPNQRNSSAKSWKRRECSLGRFPGQPRSWIVIGGPLSENLDASFAAVLAQDHLVGGP